MRLSGILHEQKLNVQACFTSGLLLTGALYMTRAEDIPRRLVILTLVTVTISLELAGWYTARHSIVGSSAASDPKCTHCRNRA